MTDTTDTFLQIDDGATPPRRVALRDGMTLGRSATADVQLDSPAVSRHHATLTRDAAGQWCLQDHDSHNGTYLNGQRTTTAAIHPGDRIQIDRYTLELTTARATHTNGSPDAAGVSVLRDIEPPRVSIAHLATLNHFGVDLLQTEADDQRRRALCQLMVGTDFHAQAAVVLRHERALADGDAPSDDDLLCPVQRPAHQPDTPVYFSRTLLRVVSESGEPTMASNVRRAAGTASGGRAATVELSVAADRQPMAAIACPIDARETEIDLLYVVLPPTFATGEWLALVALAVRQYQQAELAWAGRRQGAALAVIERELQQARKLQMRLIPQQRTVPGLDTAIAFEPCRWVGGDYADILPLPDGRALLTVADVCGKGMQAALTTTSVHAMVHAGVRAGADLAQLMQNVNEHLVEALPDGAFVTMAALVIDPNTGELTCINAGHPPVFAISPSGDVRQLEVGVNLPLGIMPDAPTLSHDQLPPGHWLALYSDGLTELPDAQGQLLGITGLANHFRQQIAATPRTTAADLARQLMTFVHNVEAGRDAGDDYTLLLARRG